MKAIIFDLDGVLIDAKDWHYEALNKALGLFGYRIGRNDHLKIYNGLPTAKKLEIMKIPKGLQSIIKKMKKKYTFEMVEKCCKPDKEKQEMLLNLKIVGKYRLACCSNAIKSSVIHMLTKAEILDYFELVLGNDEVKNPKPDPEIYQLAFKKMNLKPKDCLIVEDAPYGIESAKRSGAKVIEISEYRNVNLNLFKDYL
jgi:HAD superfamily hydrolase (TIGR01509 family)